MSARQYSIDMTQQNVVLIRQQNTLPSQVTTISNALHRNSEETSDHSKLNWDFKDQFDRIDLAIQDLRFSLNESKWLNTMFLSFIDYVNPLKDTHPLQISNDLAKMICYEFCDDIFGQYTPHDYLFANVSDDILSELEYTELLIRAIREDNDDVVNHIMEIANNSENKFIIIANVLNLASVSNSSELIKYFLVYVVQNVQSIPENQISHVGYVLHMVHIEHYNLRGIDIKFMHWMFVDYVIHHYDHQIYANMCKKYWRDSLNAIHQKKYNY